MIDDSRQACAPTVPPYGTKNQFMHSDEPVPPWLHMRSNRSGVYRCWPATGVSWAASLSITNALFQPSLEVAWKVEIHAGTLAAALEFGLDSAHGHARPAPCPKGTRHMTAGFLGMLTEPAGGRPGVMDGQVVEEDGDGRQGEAAATCSRSRRKPALVPGGGRCPRATTVGAVVASWSALQRARSRSG